MNNRIVRMIAIATASVALLAAQEKPAPDAKPVLEAMEAIGSTIASAGEREETQPSAAAAKQARSAKNSVILVTGGAAAGAAIGAALGKDSKAAMIGAAVGGVAGLIYDRLTYKLPGKI